MRYVFKERGDFVEGLKIIKGTNGKYSISNMGKVYSHVGKSGDIIPEKLEERKVQISIWGYSVVDILFEGKRKKYPIHRLVACNFIENPGNKPCVNHKDGNKQNNLASNLEWVTYSENEKHSHEILGKKAPNCRAVEVCTKEGVFVDIFESLNAACRYTGAQQSNALKNINGIRTHAANHTYKYIEV
jgi:hypothetical protein